MDKKVRALVVKNADLEASKLSKLEKSEKALQANNKKYTLLYKRKALDTLIADNTPAPSSIKCYLYKGKGHIIVNCKYLNFAIKEVIYYIKHYAQRRKRYKNRSGKKDSKLSRPRYKRIIDRAYLIEDTIKDSYTFKSTISDTLLEEAYITLEKIRMF